MGALLPFAKLPPVANSAFVFPLDKANKLTQMVAQLPGKSRMCDKWRYQHLLYEDEFSSIMVYKQGVCM